MLSANIYALFARRLGSRHSYHLLRDSFFYAFGTFSIWALIATEIGDLILIKGVIGKETTACAARNMSCLLVETNSAAVAQWFHGILQAGLGILAIVFLLSMYASASNARLWRPVVALIGVFAINALMLELVIGPTIDWLKDRGLMG